jgi:calcineurin-like phosphoesterase family protein
MKPLPRQLDVGVDVHDYRPISLAAAVEAARGRRSPGG